MFYKVLVAALALAFLTQNLSYLFVREGRKEYGVASAAGPQTPSQSSPTEQASTVAQAELELWNCVSLFYGANITPSLSHKREFWRLLTCFFLHETFLHFAINALIIVSYSQFMRLDDATLVTLTVPGVVLGNLLSALLYPDFLKLGASLLTFVLCGLSIAQQRKFYTQETALNGAMVTFLMFSASSGRLDHSAHIFGLAYGFIYAVCRRADRAKYFWLGCLAAFLGLCYAFSRIPDVPENRFAAELDYGCSFVYESLTGGLAMDGRKF